MIKCKYCKALNNEDTNSCTNCGALLPKRANLNEKEKNNLSNYINSIEEMLKASKGKKDAPIFISFVLLSLLLIAEIIGLNQLTNLGGITITIVSILFGSALFIVFGYIVTKVEEKAISKAYNERIKTEIIDYLEQMHFENIDFKLTAIERLPKNAYLFRFLDEF